MNKKILILFFLASISSHSQIQEIFYVDDVNTIEYVTANFCVNDSGEIDKVTILKNKTTYKNTEAIEQLITYLKSLQYNSDSEFRNDCYDLTFEFVNKKYETSELKESDYSKCKKFKTGEFKYLDIRYRNTEVRRREKIQTERSDNFRAIYDVTWPSPCEYQLKCLKVKGEENQYLVGKIIKVKIIGLLDDSYIYKADFLNNPTVIGEMKKIK